MPVSPHRDPVCTFPLPHMCPMLHASHSSWFDDPNVWWVQIIKCVIMSSSPLPHYHIHHRTKYLLSILFPNTLSLCSLLTVGYLVSHPYKTKAKLYFSVFTFIISDIRLEDKKILHQIMASIPWLQSALNFLHAKNFD